MKNFKEKLIDVIEYSEIDLEYPFYDGDERNEVDMPDAEIWWDIESLDIDKAINALQELKKKGADRVYLYGHTGHHAYIFTGVKLEEV